MGVRRRLRDAVDALSFIAQWLAYVTVKTLSPLWERDDSLWVFGARGGEAFADNSKYLFLHVAAERPDIRPVWLSKNRQTVAELQANGYEAYYAYSLRGLSLNLRAGVVFLTQGHRDVAMPCCAGALTVLLWHGIPLKHISWDAEFPDEPRSVRAAHTYMAGEFDVLTVPSEALAETFESGLRVPRDRMAVADYPRNDALFAEISGEHVGSDEAALRRVRELAADDAVVCYLPTYRSDPDESPSERLDFRALDDFLAERDAFLVVKTHPKEDLSLPDGLTRVLRLPPEVDVYPLLRHADALVTDYSSVYFDYLPLDRPVVFFPYDLDRYRERRGFYFDYDAVTPGPVAREFDDLLAALDQVLDDADDSHAAERRALRERLLGGDSGISSASDSASLASPSARPTPTESTPSDSSSPDSPSTGSSSKSTLSESGFPASESPPPGSPPSDSATPSSAPRSAAVYELVRRRLVDRSR